MLSSSWSRSKYISWCILFFAALNVIFLGGKRRAFGIFVAQLQVEFNDTSLAELNWIGDSYAALGYMTTSVTTSAVIASGRNFRLFQLSGAFFIFFSCLTSAYVPNPHWLFVTHTILHGIGSSLILGTVGLVVNEHFDKNHKYHILATTLVSGGSVASIVFVQFYAFLIETYGWRLSFIILGILYFFVNSSAALVFAKNPAKVNYQSTKCSWNLLAKIHPLQTVLLVLWTIDRIMTSIVTYGLLLNLAYFMRRSEASLQKSAPLTTLFAAGEASSYLIGTVTSALTQNLLKNRLKYILLTMTPICSVLLIVWEALPDHKGVMSLTFAYFSGLCLGPSITFLFPAGEELTLLPGHLAYPFSLAGMGMGMLLSPIFSALIAQMFKFKYFFFVQGIMTTIKFCCLLVCVLIVHRYGARIRAHTVVEREPHDSETSLLGREDARSLDEIDVESCEQENRISSVYRKNSTRFSRSNSQERKSHSS
ncbi:hypothetical protein Ciccas_005129 [Cichlidogyrus casuarinus]|uniref:Major facilitator superfamily (MFS) profile domain-containing protein n=1 Tax=Cichlidogyrus casuarinus TaxID=1844966 RepID=A0ABD2Q9M0_9PLAT